jgi:hypothetical protein
MPKKYLLIAIFSLLVPLCILGSNDSGQIKTAKKLSGYYISWFAGKGLPAAELKKVAFTEETLETLSRITALKEAYPHLKLTVLYDSGADDWLLRFGSGEELYWADGRLLPPELRQHAKEYRSYLSYQQLDHIPDPQQFSAEMIERLRRRQKERKQHGERNRRVYEGSYLKLLYGGNTQAAIENYLVRTTFLGYRFRVHTLLKPALANVEKRINAALKKKPELQIFLNSLSSIETYNWRPVRDSTSLSYHSFGAAVDILPRNRSKAIYWGWEEAANSEWFLVPLERRWMVPPEILEAFEAEGFIWGGKWILYDNMHFEYRPELIKLFNYKKELNLLKGGALNA